MATAQEIYDSAPIGSWVAFNDGTAPPPALSRLGNVRPDFRRWASRNGEGRLTWRNSDVAYKRFFALEIDHGLATTEKLFTLDCGLRFEVTFTPGAQPRTEE